MPTWGSSRHFINQMKHLKFCIALIVMITAILPVRADIYSVHFYDKDEGVLLHHEIDKIKNMTFVGDMVSVELKDGNIVTVPFSKISKFTIEETQTVNVETIETLVNDISIIYDAAKKALIVKSSDDISNISVFSIDGKLAVMQQPDATEAEINVSSIRSGVYIISVSTSHMTKSLKFAIN